jgi:hypothetical protein
LHAAAGEDRRADLLADSEHDHITACVERTADPRLSELVTRADGTPPRVTGIH